MRIFFNKATGEVVGSIDGFSTDPAIDKMDMTIPGVEVGKINVGIGHPQEELVRRVERGELTVFDLKIEGDGVREFTPTEYADRQAKRDAQKKANEAWHKANPPRDPLAEIDDLRAQIAAIRSNIPTPPKP